MTDEAYTIGTTLGTYAVELIPERGRCPDHKRDDGPRCYNALIFAPDRTGRTWVLHSRGREEMMTRVKDWVSRDVEERVQQQRKAIDPTPLPRDAIVDTIVHDTRLGEYTVKLTLQAGRCPAVADTDPEKVRCYNALIFAPDRKVSDPPVILHGHGERATEVLSRAWVSRDVKDRMTQTREDLAGEPGILHRAASGLPEAPHLRTPDAPPSIRVTFDAEHHASLTVGLEIVTERAAQRERGYDAAHDDGHSLYDFLAIVRGCLYKAQAVEIGTEQPARRIYGRADLVKAAAVLVAAIEAYDRETARMATAASEENL